MSCSILYTWITSALSRLYSNVGNPNARSLSLYGKCDIHIKSFVARLCTFSIAILSFLKTGDHTGDAYSKCVRTNDLNKFNENVFIQVCKGSKYESQVSVSCFDLRACLWFLIKLLPACQNGQHQ